MADKTAIPPEVSQPFTLFGELDIHLFKMGKHYKLYEKLGARPVSHGGQAGVYFAVWAPNASAVSVIGDFNGWDPTKTPMYNRWDGSGIWEAFVPGISEGTLYKYAITNADSGELRQKSDPFAFAAERPPKTASRTVNLRYKWSDEPWMKRRRQTTLKTPMSIYEVHLGSWRRRSEEDNRSLTYIELAEELADYVSEMGFTHVELLPVAEHPFYGSWGYQCTGFFAPTSRYGSPQDFMHLVDSLHKRDIAVIMDWVPSHFPGDEHGLFRFDGTHVYEHADPRKGFHPDWKSYIFNYGRLEVRSFLISSAMFWLDKYHIDSLRVDAVASMLYLDYSRKAGEWEPNEFGGNENLEAISFLKELNESVHAEFPEIAMIAEESTAWPKVSRPTHDGGLGFGQKWMMGWMHDTLQYFGRDPVHRSYHQNEITFSLCYAFHENFVLPLSHDEVVHGKGSLISRMPGDSWQQFANLRTLLAYMYTHPGSKLLFMGGEFGQYAEWDHDKSLDWHLLDVDLHRKLQHLVRALNALYRSETALFERQYRDDGFEWIDSQDASNCVLSYIRRGDATDDLLVVVVNLTAVPREEYEIGVPLMTSWNYLLDSDDSSFGGSGYPLLPTPRSAAKPYHGQPYSLRLHLPPLSVLVLKAAAEVEK